MRTTRSRLRFPRTSDKRTSPGFLRIVTGVDLYAPPGLQFAGQIVSPGAEFDPGDLPRPAVMIESVGSVRTASGRSRYSFTALWVLWNFDFEANAWREVLRSFSNDATWSLDFAPVAHRLLHPGEPSSAEADARPVTEQLASVIRSRLEVVPREVRCYALAGLAEHVSREIVRITDSLSVLKVGYGDGAVYPAVGADENGRRKPRQSAA